MNATPDKAPRSRPRATVAFGLLALNGALLLALALVTFGPRADAQTRPRGAYNMVAGGVQGTDSGVVYIVDGVSQELIALTFDTSSKQLKPIGYRNLSTDARALLGGGNR